MRRDIWLTPGESVGRAGRLLAVDALRGFDMFCLLIADQIIRALIRVVIMVFLGTWVNGNLLTYDPARFQMTYSALQMLAIAYLISVLFVLFAKLRGQLIGFAVLLFGWLFLCFLYRTTR